MLSKVIGGFCDVRSHIMMWSIHDLLIAHSVVTDDITNVLFVSDDIMQCHCVYLG